MNFVKSFCVFFAVTEIFCISVYTVGVMREVITREYYLYQTHYSSAVTDWQYLMLSLVLLIELVLITAAVLLYKGTSLEKRFYFLPWLIIHGIFTAVGSVGCFITLFNTSYPTVVFHCIAFVTGILWAKWITVWKCFWKIRQFKVDPVTTL